MSDDGAVLNQVNIVVGDVARSAGFFSLLGIEISSPPPEWMAHHREATMPDGLAMDIDSPQSARLWDAGWPGGTGVVIGFRVPSRDAVDRMYEKVTAAGHPGQQPPYDAFWGARYAIVQDPDGNAIGIMSPIDPSRASRPPTPGA